MPDLRAKAGGAAGAAVEARLGEFRAAVEDDLNMPRALAAMWGAIKDGSASPSDVYATLLAMDEVLGLGFAEMQEKVLSVSEDDIQSLIDQRQAARKAKDFARADAIRDELAAKGVTLEDTPQGTVWRRS